MTRTTRHAQPDDRDTLIEILIDAFIDDPIFAHHLEDPARPGFATPAAIRACMEAEADSYLGHGHTYMIDADAAALWTPPGVSADTGALREAFGHHGIDERLEASFPAFVELADWHPEEPHFYLHLIGARSRARGQGAGSKLLERVLRVCDAEQIPAYLEASTSRSVGLYARHGFEQIATVEFAPNVALRPMLRLPV